MKRLITVFLCFVMLGIMCPKQARAEAVSAKGAVLLEANTGRILYEKNPDTRLPMASTTKIMTAIIAIESGRLEETVTVSKSAVGVEGSSVYLKEGEKLKLMELVYGLMLSSGNDAAVAIAEFVGGDVERFVAMMNQKAQELGAKNTHFVNPNGLHHEDHYTTARDLATMAAYGMRNEQFVKVVSSTKAEIANGEKDYPRYLRNKNKILTLYEGGNGVKTGYTKAAGRCLVSAAKRGEMQLVCAVINAPNMFEDCMQLMDKGFGRYRNITAVKKGEGYGSVAVAGNKQVPSLEAVAEEDLICTLSEEEIKGLTMRVHLVPAMEAPVEKGVVVGQAEVLIRDKKVGTVNLIANNGVKPDNFMYNLKEFIKGLFH